MQPDTSLLWKKGLLAAVIMLSLFTACKKDKGPSLGVDLVSVTTETPANVRLLFKVDAGDQDVPQSLQMGDIEIFEDNVLLTSLESQAQIQDEPEEFLFSTLLLLDFSGSVLNDDDLNQVKDAVGSFIELVMPDSTQPGYKVKEMAIYWFNGKADIHPLVDYTFNKDTLLAGIYSVTDSLSNDFSTNLNGAIIEGVTNLSAKMQDGESDFNQSNIANLVIFTDGIDLAGRETEEGALTAVELLTNQYLVSVIGLGEDIDEGFLKDIGRDGHYFAKTSSDLNPSFIDMATQVNRDYQSFYALEYCSPKRLGEHVIQIRAYLENKAGRFDTEFAADGFDGGCVIE